MNKAYNAINWKNEPSTSTPINETNLNKMDRAIDTIDNRVIDLDNGKVNKEEGKSLVSNTDIPKIGANETAIQNHISDKSNPHSVTKAQVGLGNTDNTSDADKPISTAQQAEFDSLNNNLYGLEYGENGAYNLLKVSEDNVIAYDKYGNYKLTDDGFITTGNCMIGFLVKVKPNTKYFYGAIGNNCSYGNWRIREYSSKPTSYVDNSFIIESVNGGNYGISTVFTTSENTQYILAGKYDSNTNAVISQMQITESDIATPYKPYIPSVAMLAEENAQQNTKAMDLKMLGWTVPKECPIQNYVDADGVFHQRVGRVDLGSLNYNFNTTFGFKINDFTIGQSDIVCSKYYNRNYVWNDYQDTLSSGNTYFISRDGVIFLSNGEYTDQTTFKNAMQGIYLYYELETEQTISVDGNEAVTKVNDSLTQLEYSEVAGGKNLIDFSKIIKGYELNGENLIVNVKWYVTDYIKVKPNTTYTISGTSSNYACEYDSNKNYISSSRNQTFTTSNTTEYVRANSIISGYDNAMLEEGTTATPYEHYIPSVKMLAEEVSAQKINNDSLADYGLNNVLEGLIQGFWSDDFVLTNSNEDTTIIYPKTCNVGDIITLKIPNYTGIKLYFKFFDSSNVLLQKTIIDAKYENIFVAPENAVIFSFTLTKAGITPENVGHVGLYINNAIDELKSDLSAYADGTKAVAKATTADRATKATQDGNGNIITDTYLRKTDSTNVLLPIGSMIMCDAEQIPQYYGTWVDLGTTTITCTTGTGEDIMDVTYTIHVFSRTA